MRNNTYALLLIWMIFCSCSSKKELNDLIENETTYFYKDSNKPFSGKVYNTKTNLKDESFVSAYYTFHNGIPKGSWKSFGYHKEIIQEGTFKPLLEISDLKNIFPYISRINTCKYSEGKYQIINIYVISKNLGVDSIDFNFKKLRVLNFLQEKDILSKADLTLINSCEIYSGEF